MTPPKKSPRKSPATAAKKRENPPSVMLVREGEESKPLPDMAPEKGIGGRIKEAREYQRNQLSIEALSRMCKLIDPIGQGISQQTLVKYEKGIVLPGARELRILCNALLITADWLLFGVERSTKGSSVFLVEDAMLELTSLLHERMARKNPVKYIDPEADVVRPALLAKAREPQPRK